MPGVSECGVLSSVCSSPPIHMKVQPLNQTALQVSWSQPETIYHPPIMNYMISYSWTKNEDEKEKTFTKDSDKDLVKAPCCGRNFGDGPPAVSLRSAKRAGVPSLCQHSLLPPAEGARGPGVGSAVPWLQAGDGAPGRWGAVHP